MLYVPLAHSNNFFEISIKRKKKFPKKLEKIESFLLSVDGPCTDLINVFILIR